MSVFKPSNPLYYEVTYPFVFREDVVTPSYDRKDILKNSPSQEGGCYLVPKVVE